MEKDKKDQSTQEYVAEVAKRHEFPTNAYEEFGLEETPLEEEK